MADETVFLDTAALIALANRDDSLHARSMAVRDQLVGQRASIMTTEWVLAEFLGNAARGRFRQLAGGMVERLRRSDRLLIVHSTHESWESGFALFQSRPDKDWSLVDCISILCCQQHAIRRVFTHDHHFVQAGLEILL